MRHINKRIRDGSRNTMRSLLVGALFMLAVCLPAQGVFALGTPAGTPITNQATATYNIGATNFSEPSNTTTTLVAEILNVTVTWQDISNINVSAGDTNEVLTFLLANTGNGSDSYDLSVLNSPSGPGGFTATLADIYLDTNGSGVYDAGDTQYVLGTNTPPLAADTDVAVFVLNDIPAGPLASGALGDSQLTVMSVTPPAPGPWAAGTVVAGGGEAPGTDAVVGTSGGSTNETGTYIVSDVVVTLSKSYTISADPVFGTEPVPGAVITYSIDVTVTGSGTAENLVITDAIPTNTTYDTGTMALDGFPLTDPGGDDAGDVGATTADTVTVNLSDVAAGSPAQTITFNVTID